MCDCYLQFEKIIFCPCMCLIYFCTYTGQYCCCGYSDSVSHASIPYDKEDKTLAIEDDTVAVEDDEI